MSSDSDPDYSLSIYKLRDELETVLKSDLNIDGNYYAAIERGFAIYTNPQINIEGIGPIELPLSVENAKKIIQVASKAPYGNGEQTIVDVQVRDTWQIEPSKVQFECSYWENDLEAYARSVYRELGVSDSSNPKWEFYKLLLYEAGSHFLPHQDSEKAEGMFATMVIILPSAYEGGQVHLQHGSKQDIIDVSSNCGGISLLGWYTDVMHEVKPITSGYRLALSYNLIHTCMESPVPHLTPEDVGMARLKAVLKKWNTSKIAFKSIQETLLVYILDHKYSHFNLEMGVRSLKGKDASTVACLQEAGEELGITMLLGTSEYFLSGRGRLEPGYESGGPDDGQTPEDFSEIEERELTIDHLVDTRGNEIEVISKIKVPGAGNFIPKAYFTWADPENTNQERYYGNDGNDREHWYRQSALVLLRKKDAHEILYNAGGADYVVSRLERLTGLPSKYDKILAERMLRDSDAWSLDDNARKMALQTMADCFVNWNEPRLWLDCVAIGQYMISTFGFDRLFNGLRAFGFKTVQECFEEVIVTKQSLERRLEFIDALPTNSIDSDQAHVWDWCKDQLLRVFHHLGPLELENVPTLVEFAIAKGTTSTLDVIFSQLKDSAISFDAVFALMKALFENKTAILECLEGSNKQDFDEITRLCIDMATEEVQQQPYISPSERERNLGRIISILNFSVSVKQPEACAKLVKKLTEIDNEPGRLEELFVPLAYQVSDHIRAKGLGLAEGPYSTLLTTIIDDYFGTFPPIDQKLANLREIGCGCSICTPVDAFIQDVTLEHEDFELSFLCRIHVETHLMKAEDLVYFLPLQKGQTNPYGLQIRKLPLTLLTLKWQRRLAAANKFLDRIGTAEELSALPGNKYVEIQQTLAKLEHTIRGDGDMKD